MSVQIVGAFVELLFAGRKLVDTIVMGGGADVEVLMGVMVQTSARAEMLLEVTLRYRKL